MSKNKVRLEERIHREGEDSSGILSEVDKNGLCFTKLKEIEDFGPDYTITQIKVFGQKLEVVMKPRLCGALLDPSAEDLEILRNARIYSRRYLTDMFSKKKLDPSNSNFSRTLDDKYLSSLVMNIIKYPTNKPFEENLEKMGLKDPEISKLYAEAASAWAGEPVEPDFGGIIGKLEKISSWTGNSDSVDLSVENCERGSHYILKTNVKKKQERVQREVIENRSYSSIEYKIVGRIQERCQDVNIKSNAQNMVRMFLNLACLYDKDKPLPIK